MLILNYLEKIGKIYKVGNIKKVAIYPELIEVHKRDRSILKYRRVNGNEDIQTTPPL